MKKQHLKCNTQSIFAKLFALILGILAITALQPAFAGESPFGWLYTAEVAPEGTKEFEQWIDVQSKQTQGKYSNMRLRSEIEYGVTPKYQTALYANSRYIVADRNGINGDSGGPNTDIPAGFDTTNRFKMSRLESISWENIYQISNPLVDPIGLAIYSETTLGPRNREQEFKLIFQKNFLDDRLIWVTNFVTAFEKNERGSATERATEFDTLTGISYRFIDRWSAGLELRNHREFTGYGYGTANHSAWFFGPNVHYGSKKWWMTAAYRRQLPIAAGFQDDQRDVIREGRIYGDEHTMHQIIIKVGIPF